MKRLDKQFDLDNPTILYDWMHNLAETHGVLQEIETIPDTATKDQWANATFNFLFCLGFYPQIVYYDGGKTKGDVADWALILNQTTGLYAVVPRMVKENIHRFDLAFPVCGPEQDFEKITLDGEEVEGLVTRCLPHSVVTISQHFVEETDYVWHVTVREQYLQPEGHVFPLVSGTAMSSSYELALMQAMTRLLHAIAMDRYASLMADYVDARSLKTEDVPVRILHTLQDEYVQKKNRERIKRLHKKVKWRRKQEAANAEKQAAASKAHGASRVFTTQDGTKIDVPPPGPIKVMTKEPLKNDPAAAEMVAKATGAKTDVKLDPKFTERLSAGLKAMVEESIISAYVAKVRDSVGWKGMIEMVSMVARVDHECARSMYRDAIATMRERYLKAAGDTDKAKEIFARIEKAFKDAEPVAQKIAA